MDTLNTIYKTESYDSLSGFIDKSECVFIPPILNTLGYFRLKASGERKKEKDN